MPFFRSPITVFIHHVTIFFVGLVEYGNIFVEVERRAYRKNDRLYGVNGVHTFIQPKFRGSISPPSSWSNKGTCSFRSLVDIQWTARCYSPDSFSMALRAHSGLRPLVLVPYSFFTVGRTPWTGDQPVTRPLPAHRTTQTQNKRIHTPNIHALSGS
jgi:hypothetical protein